MDKFMKALQFAAYKHRSQKRKDPDKTPYINHPIGVAHILSNEAGILDYDILAVALLHDTIEDTETTLQELENEFGQRIASIDNLFEEKVHFYDCDLFFKDLVLELSDDKDLKKQERKQLQIDNAKNLTHDAILVRLADKIYNLRDLNRVRPVGWSDQRITEYFEWSVQIARQLTGHNQILDDILKDLFLQRNIQM